MLLDVGLFTPPLIWGIRVLFVSVKRTNAVGMEEEYRDLVVPDFAPLSDRERAERLFEYLKLFRPSGGAEKKPDLSLTHPLCLRTPRSCAGSPSDREQGS